jgi:hypothetical protein
MINNRNIAHSAAMAMAEFSFFRVAAVMVAIAAFAISFSEIALSHDAAFTLATGQTASLLAIIAASAAFVKMFWIPGATAFWSKRQYAATAAAVLFGIIAHAYSIQAVLSLAASGRDAVVSQRGNEIGKRERVEQQYAAAKATVASTSGSRPSVDVQRDLTLALEQVETAKKAQASAESRAAAELSTGAGNRYNLAVTDSREALAKVEAGQKRLRDLDAEWKLALQSEQARKDMATLNAQLDGMGAAGHKDPQAAVMTDYLAMVGIKASERSVSLGSLLPILLIVELGGALAMTIACGLWAAGSPAPIVRPSGGIAVATFAPDVPPMEPVKMLPTPVPSKEQQTFRALTRMIALERGNSVTASGNELADHLGVPRSSMHEHLKRWSNDGRVTLGRDGNRYVIGLPTRALVAARREMVAA